MTTLLWAQHVNGEARGFRLTEDVQTEFAAELAAGDFFLCLSRFSSACELFELDTEPSTYLEAAQADPLAFAKLSDLQKESFPHPALYDWT